MTVKVLHIGLGIRGSHWLGFVAGHAGTQTVACVDADKDALDRARGQVDTDVRLHSDVSEAIEAGGADAALIASPSHLHADHAIAALEAGMSVMIEKPFAQDVAEARRILEVARRQQRQVVIAENYRYWPSERTIREWVAGGRLGPIHNVTLVDRRHMPSRTEGPWLAKIDHPQLGEIGIHHIDSLRGMLMAEPVSVMAHSWNPKNSDYSHGACTAATLRLGDTRVQYMGTLTSPRFSFSLRLEGEKGELWTNRRYVFFRPPGQRFFRPVRNVAVPPGDEKKYPQGGTTSLLQSLCNAVEKNEPAETSGEDNLGTLAAVQAAKRSDLERRTVEIGEILEG